MTSICDHLGAPHCANYQQIPYQLPTTKRHNSEKGTQTSSFKTKTVFLAKECPSKLTEKEIYLEFFSLADEFLLGCIDILLLHTLPDLSENNKMHEIYITNRIKLNC